MPRTFLRPAIAACARASSASVLQTARADRFAHEVLVPARGALCRPVRSEPHALAQLVCELDAGLGAGEHVAHVETRELRCHRRRAVVRVHDGDEIIGGERRAEELGYLPAAVDRDALMPVPRE